MIEYRIPRNYSVPVLMALAFLSIVAFAVVAFIRVGGGSSIVDAVPPPAPVVTEVGQGSIVPAPAPIVAATPVASTLSFTLSPDVPLPTTTPWESLPASTRLALSKRALAEAILALPWVNDGVSEGELPVVDRLVAVELAFGEEGDPALVGKQWVSDGIDQEELATILRLDSMATASEAHGGSVFRLQFLDSLEEADTPTLDTLFSLLRSDYQVLLLRSVLERPWVDDGLNPIELTVVKALASLDARAEDEGQQISAMPFLDTVEDADVSAVQLLTSVGTRDQPLLARLVRKGWLADGLDAEEARVVTSLGSLAGVARGDALSVVNLPFLDRVEHGDADSTLFLADLRVRQQELFRAVLEKSWIRDGVDAFDIELLDMLDSLAAINQPSALHLASLPFLDTIDPADVVSVLALVGLGIRQPELFEAALSRPWVRDGIDEPDAVLVMELERMGDRTEAARRWAALGSGGSERPFAQGSPTRHFDADGNGAIGYAEAAAAAAAHLRGELNIKEVAEIISLYAFADGIVPEPTAAELAAANG